jgi:hypothetical protein
MEKMFVKPAPGLKVRLPENPSAFLPDDGAEVERNAFWLRRLRDEDVVHAAPASKPTAKPASKKE